MKKSTSIFLVLLMIAAMMHFSVATHYCGGKIAASKVSLKGKLANCGMEGPDKELPLPGITLSKHCCEDVVTVCGTDNNYTPSFSFIPESYQHNFQVLALAVGLSFNSKADLITSYINVTPPGALMSTDVDLTDICVFRI